MAVLLHNGNIHPSTPIDCPFCPQEGNRRAYGFVPENYTLLKIWMQTAQDDLLSRTGGAAEKGKTLEEMERRDRKGSSCARSEEMERPGDR
jgi:hypothetical protein